MYRGNRFTQPPRLDRLDFFETFSPAIGGFDVVRTVVAISVMLGWNIWTLDFHETYLIAALSEGIWLELPGGSNVKGQSTLRYLRT